MYACTCVHCKLPLQTFNSPNFCRRGRYIVRLNFNIKYKLSSSGHLAHLHSDENQGIFFLSNVTQHGKTGRMSVVACLFLQLHCIIVVVHHIVNP
jgi:hypothetical protein